MTKLIEFITVASVTSYFLLGVATNLKGQLFTGLWGPCWACDTSIGDRFSGHETHRRFQLAKSTN